MKLYAPSQDQLRRLCFLTFFCWYLQKTSGITLQGTNISSQNGILKMIFLFPRWDMLISWRVVPVVVVCHDPSPKLKISLKNFRETTGRLEQTSDASPWDTPRSFFPPRAQCFGESCTDVLIVVSGEFVSQDFSKLWAQLSFHIFVYIMDFCVSVCVCIMCLACDLWVCKWPKCKQPSSVLRL